VAPPPRIDGETYHLVASFLLEQCAFRDAPDVAAYLEQRGVFADAEAVGVRALPREQRALVRVLRDAFTHETLHLAGILRERGEAIEWGDSHRLLIPWHDRRRRVSAIQRRRLDAGRPRYLFPPRLSPSHPFGAELYDEALAYHAEDADIVVTEGALDTLARRKLGRLHHERCVVLGIPSASTFSDAWAGYFTGRRVVLAFDGDDAGDAAAERFAAAVCAGAATVVRERPVGAKDVNEVLLQEIAA
jgi:DNA primase